MLMTVSATAVAYVIADSSYLLGRPAVIAAGSDDFLCYGARTTNGMPAPSGARVGLRDQFENKDFDLKNAKHVCIPVDRNGQGVSDAGTHLKSYKIRRAKGEPKHTKQLNLRVLNQFGELFVDTRREDFLLVPSATCIDEPPGVCPGSATGA